MLNSQEHQHYAQAIAYEALQMHSTAHEALVHVAGEAVQLWEELQFKRSGGFERLGPLPKHRAGIDYLSLLIELSGISHNQISSFSEVGTNAYLDIIAPSMLSTIDVKTTGKFS